MDNCNLKKNFVIKLANSEDVEELRFLIQVKNFFLFDYIFV